MKGGSYQCSPTLYPSLGYTNPIDPLPSGQHQKAGIVALGGVSTPPELRCLWGAGGAQFATTKQHPRLTTVGPTWCTTEGWPSQPIRSIAHSCIRNPPALLGLHYCPKRAEASPASLH